MSRRFSIRAECSLDVDQLRHILADRACDWRIRRAKPGVLVSFVSDMAVDGIRRAARCVPDGQRMAETVVEVGGLASGGAIS